MYVFLDHWGAILVATGALGTAAYGIVEALKIFPAVSGAGFGQILRTLGPLLAPLELAYGRDWKELLRAQFQDGRGSGELPRTLRQGLRIGLTPDNAAAMAERLGSVDGDRLAEAARRIHAGEELPDELRGVLGRFELAVDSRIAAALALAECRYAGTVRALASMLAVAIALAVGAAVSAETGADGILLLAAVVGVAAVPLAPIAKDLVSALNAAAGALRARS